MSRPLDNVNPTIFATNTASTSRRQPRSATALLWNDDTVGYEAYEGNSSGGSDDEREEIDAEEVYGESRFPLCGSDTAVCLLQDLDGFLCGRIICADSF